MYCVYRCEFVISAEKVWLSGQSATCHDNELNYEAVSISIPT